MSDHEHDYAGPDNVCHICGAEPEDPAVEPVALHLFARSFIPSQRVDAVRVIWADAPESTLHATREAAREIIALVRDADG